MKWSTIIAMNTTIATNDPTTEHAQGTRLTRKGRFMLMEKSEPRMFGARMYAD